MFVQRKIKVLLEYHEVLFFLKFFLTEAHKLLIVLMQVSLEHTFVKTLCDDVCFSVVIVLLANVMFMLLSYISGF